MLFCIQVITAFVATSSLALCLTLAHTVFTIVDVDTFYAIDDWTARQRWRLIPPERMSGKLRLKWIGILERIILTLSDQQLLLGLAILVSGLIRVCSISVYHFTIVSDLGWFASNTHIMSLTALWRYFRKNHTMRDWRAALMATMFVFQFAYTVMTSHWAWDESYSSHAKCVFDDLVGNISGSSAWWMGFYLFLLTTTYPRIITWLYEDATEAYKRWLYQNPRNFMTSKIRQLQDHIAKPNAHENRTTFILRKALGWGQLLFWRSLYITHRILVIYDDSIVIAWLVNLLWFAVGLYLIVLDRSIDPQYMNGDENEMGFGQLIPVFLLASTAFVFQEAFDGESCHRLFE